MLELDNEIHMKVTLTREYSASTKSKLVLLISPDLGRHVIANLVLEFQFNPVKIGNSIIFKPTHYFTSRRAFCITKWLLISSLYNKL